MSRIAAQLRVNEREEEEANRPLCISSHSSESTCPLRDRERNRPLPSSGTIAIPMAWGVFGVKVACPQVAPAREMAKASLPYLKC